MVPLWRTDDRKTARVTHPISAGGSCSTARPYKRRPPAENTKVSRAAVRPVAGLPERRGGRQSRRTRALGGLAYPPLGGRYAGAQLQSVSGVSGTVWLGHLVKLSSKRDCCSHYRVRNTRACGYFYQACCVFIALRCTFVLYFRNASAKPRQAAPGFAHMFCALVLHSRLKGSP